jgi:type II secretory pathway component PulL
MRYALDRELLAAWLNFANGAVSLDDPVDVDNDKVPDETFAQAMTTAESVWLDANATKDALAADSPSAAPAP